MYHVCTPEVDIANDEICWDNDEFEVGSRSCVVIEWNVLVNNVKKYVV
jgi:hypothetical protein